MRRIIASRSHHRQIYLILDKGGVILIYSLEALINCLSCYRKARLDLISQTHSRHVRTSTNIHMKRTAGPMATFSPLPHFQTPSGGAKLHIELTIKSDLVRINLSTSYASIFGVW